MSLLLIIAVIAVCGLSPEVEAYGTLNCWTAKCGYCSNMDCAVKYDLSNADQGIEVQSLVNLHKFSSILFFDENGKVIGQFQWNNKQIALTGCAGCRTPPKLRAATARNEKTSWEVSFKDSVLQIKIGGDVLYEKELEGECAEVYGKIVYFAFYKMDCDSTFKEVDGMEIGASIVAECPEEPTEGPDKFIECVDVADAATCSQLVGFNYCVTGKDYMIENCAKSCNFVCEADEPEVPDNDCVDIARGCDIIYSEGLCRQKEAGKHKQRLNCAKTCNFCDGNEGEGTPDDRYNGTIHVEDGSLTGQCTDKSGAERCAEMAKDNNCERSAATMKVHCEKTCNLCETDIDGDRETSECVDQFATCQQNKADGMCESDKKNQKFGCAKTCGFCESGIRGEG